MGKGEASGKGSGEGWGEGLGKGCGHDPNGPNEWKHGICGNCSPCGNCKYYRILKCLLISYSFFINKIELNCNVKDIFNCRLPYMLLSSNRSLSIGRQNGT